MALRHLKLLYRLYPKWSWIPEYKVARTLARRYGCRRVLDVGCGRAALRNMVEGTYVGLDLNILTDPDSLVQGDGRYPPFRLTGFDCVFFINSVFYMSPETLDLYTDARLLVIIDIDPRYPHIKLVDLLERRGRFTREKLVRFLEERGFSVLEHGGWITYYVVARPPRRAPGP